MLISKLNKNKNNLSLKTVLTFLKKISLFLERIKCKNSKTKMEQRVKLC